MDGRTLLICRIRDDEAMPAEGACKPTKRKDYYLVTILTAILVFSMTEPRLMNFAFNPFPILLFSTIRKSV